MTVVRKCDVFALHLGLSFALGARSRGSQLSSTMACCNQQAKTKTSESSSLSLDGKDSDLVFLRNAAANFDHQHCCAVTVPPHQ